MVGPCSPNTAHFYSRCWRTFSCGDYAAIKKLSKLWLGCAPQHPLSRPSWFCGVENSFRFDVMQTFNNVQVNGWWFSSKHGSAHFTLLKKCFMWMVWKFSKTFELIAGPCSPKHGPVVFTVLKKTFVWLLCGEIKTFKFMSGLRSRTTLVTAQLIPRRWGIDSSWCYADFQQRQTNGWSCSPKHGPTQFTLLKYFFVWMVWSFLKTFELKVGSCASKHDPVLITVLKNFFVWMLCSHLKTFKFMAGLRSPTSPITAQLIPRRWKRFFFNGMQIFSNV